MNTSSNTKNIGDKVIFAKSAHIFGDSHDLCTSYGVFNLDPGFGDLGICRFLFCGKLLPSGLFDWLDYSDVFRVVGLVSGILLEDAWIRYGIHRISDFLVMHLSFNYKRG